MALVATALTGLALVGSTAPGAVGGARLVPSAQLAASGGPIDRGSIAMSGGVLVAGASGFMPGTSTQGVGYVFTRPAQGWSDDSEAARLIASDGRVGDGFGSSVAISGSAAVVSSGSGGQPLGNALYVFTKPRGGWAGTLHERARLAVGPSVGPLGPVAASGTTIAVGVPQIGVDAPRTGPGAVYVFNRPRRGWSATVYPSARLTAAHEAGETQLGYAIAVSGRNIFTSAFTSPSVGTIFVFSEPRRGWKGSIHERAHLTYRSMIPGPLAVSGSSVVATTQSRPFEFGVCELVAFQRPARGWSGTRLPTARLRLTPPPVSSAGCLAVSDLADSGSTIAALAVGPDSSSCDPFPGQCREMLYTFSRPSRGWRGTIRSDANETITPPDGYAGDGGTYLLAIAGQTIATAGGKAIDIFAHAAR